MPSIWTKVLTTYGGHDRDVYVAAFATPDAMLPSLRRDVAAWPYLEEMVAQEVESMDFDDLLALLEEYNQDAEGNTIEVFETTLYDTAEQEQREYELNVPRWCAYCDAGRLIVGDGAGGWRHLDQQFDKHHIAHPRD